MKIFTGNSNSELAEKVANKMNLRVSPVEIFIFPDGERRIQIQENVVDEDVVLVQSTNTPVDHNYMELFFLIDGLKRNGARNLTLVMPYFGYQRQDHIFRSGESVSLDVVARILETLKIDKLLFIDPHTVKIPLFFNIPAISLSALPLFAQTAKEAGWSKENTVLVSPDLGGLRRIDKMSELLDGMPWIATVKDRNLDNGSIEISKFEGPYTISEFKEKRALIVDDMISSGKTIVESANLLRANGIAQIFVMVTHPVFSAEAPKLLENSIVEAVFVTDTVSMSSDKHFSKLKILSTAELIAGELKK